MDKKICKLINQNQFMIYKKERDRNIQAFATLGVQTCSCVILGINKQREILMAFMTHIDEDTDLYKMVEQFIKEIKKEDLNEIDIIYTCGDKSCKNPKRDYSAYINEIKKKSNIY